MYWRRLSIFGVVLVVVIAITALISRSNVIADPGGGTTGLGFDDPYTQIINHQIPNSDKIPIQADGKPTYTQWGHFYTGPSGVEVRFNRKGTEIATKVNVLIASAAIGTRIAATEARVEAQARSIKLLSDVVISSIKPAGLRDAAFKALNGASFVGFFDPLYEALAKDDCIGVTIPKGDNLNQILTRVDALARLGDIYKLTDDPDLNDIWRANLAGVGLSYSMVGLRVWYEPCSLNEGPKKDVVTTPPPPVADTQPVVKAEPIPVTVQPAQPTQASSPPAPVYSAPITQAAPPPPPVHVPDACWLSGSDYRTFVRPDDHNNVLFYTRQFNSIDQLQVPSPKWMHWTQNVGGEWRIEGQYKDPSGQDMWHEGDFFAAPFWTDATDQADKDNQFHAYNQLKDSWGYKMNLIHVAPQC